MAKLMFAGVVNMSSNSQVPPRTPSCETTKCDSTHVTVHVAPDKSLPTFKGDGTDKISIQDWIDMTQTYLKKKETPLD